MNTCGRVLHVCAQTSSDLGEWCGHTTIKQTLKNSYIKSYQDVNTEICFTKIF